MKDYCVRKALYDVRRAAADDDVRLRLRLSASESGTRTIFSSRFRSESCTPNCNCQYCTRIRRQRQETDQRLRDQLNHFYGEIERNRQIKEQKEAEWTKTQKLL